MIDPDPPAPLTDADFDRIVDGDLSPAELRAVLGRLGREPDGWKRCALAFLEAQCWRESFKEIEDLRPAVAEDCAPSRSAIPPLSIQRRSRLRRVATAAGIAAISFTLGWRAHPERTGLRPPTAPTTVVNAGDTASGDVGAAANPPAQIRDRAPAEFPAPATIPPPRFLDRLRGVPVEKVRAVPVVAGPMIDPHWVQNQPSPITEHQQALLEQQGYQVDRRRGLVTTTFSNGRRVTVPVDHIKVRYTGTGSL
jgi:hypothetical protein